MKLEVIKDFSMKLAFLLIAMLVVSFILTGCTTTATTENVVVTRDSKPDAQAAQEEAVLAIADGIYTAEVNYPTPGGADLIEVIVEVQEDIVTAVSLTTISGHPKSDKYVKRANEGLSDLVIGKKIDELNLPKSVSGSSLTTNAFKKHINRLIEDY